MVLQRWAPYRELRQMEDNMNRLWRGFGNWPYFHDGGVPEIMSFRKLYIIFDSRHVQGLLL